MAKNANASSRRRTNANRRDLAAGNRHAMGGGVGGVEVVVVAMIDSVFDGKWRKHCFLQPCRINTVERFIKLHYLAKRPAIVMLCLCAKKKELCLEHEIGCAVFSAPPKETMKRYGGVVWELARLYLLDSIPKNAETWLIGKSIKYIKKHHKDVQFLVSYADPSVGHNGTIYKASNWAFDGMTDDGRKTPRSDYFDANTMKKYGRKGNVPSNAVVLRKPRIKKLRFVFKLF